MEEILYAIRHHAIGLNAGVWDYAASFAARLGERPDFLFPDRAQHVTFAAPFINNYARLLIHTCHKRGALATTGKYKTRCMHYSETTVAVQSGGE